MSEKFRKQPEAALTVWERNDGNLDSGGSSSDGKKCLYSIIGRYNQKDLIINYMTIKRANQEGYIPEQLHLKGCYFLR